MVRGVIKSPIFQNKLRNWTLKLDLTEPLARNLRVRGMFGSKQRVNQTVIVLKPRMKRKTFGFNTRIRFAAFFTSRPDNMMRCAILCGNDMKTGEYMCTNNTFDNTSDVTSDNTSDVKSNDTFDNKSDNTSEVTSDDKSCLLYTSPSPRDQRGSRMPSSA